MKKFLIAAAITAVAVVAWAQYQGFPFYAPIKYVQSLPASGAFPGEHVVVISGNPPGYLEYVWDSADSDWERISQGIEENATIDGTLTVTGATTLTGGVGAVAATGNISTTGNLSVNGTTTLGTNDVDDVTVNGPVVYNVKHETFEDQAYFFMENDFTGASQADASENFLILPGSPIGLIWVSYEQVSAVGDFTPAFDVEGRLEMSDLIDNVDTDGIDFSLGGGFNQAGTSALSFIFDEDTGNSKYCEISLTIGTVANIDEFYFGWRLRQTRSSIDGNAITGADTAAYFRVPDNAGDLDIETELNGGGTNNDDTGTTWADGQTKVLRVTLAADSVSFTLDGAAVTQVNANLDLDNGDRMMCIWGFQNSAAGASAGMNLNYVEYGVSQ